MNGYLGITLAFSKILMFILFAYDMLIYGT